MDVSDVIALGAKHVRNVAAEEVYLRFGYDFTKPINFFGFVNERCNVKCRYCAYWRLDHYQKEMSIEEWQRALLSVRDFVGRFSINFSGGEPFIKPGFLDLLAWCHGAGIRSGVTTNGSALSRRNVQKLVAAKPLNVNISVDAPDAETHDYLRGFPGLFDRLCQGIGFLRQEQESRNVRFPIMIKPTITARNFRTTPEMVDWAKRAGATCVNFQPLERWTPETYDELWIDDENEQAEFLSVVDRLLEMKRNGAPIMNSVSTIREFSSYFREAPRPTKDLPSRVGLQTLFILTNGDVQLGFVKPPIGNLKQQSARDIWYGPDARRGRKQSLSHDLQAFLNSASTRKSIRDRMRMATILMRN